jgi:hypothetical protein
MRFLLIERLNNFSLKQCFLVQMTKNDLIILLRLFCHFFFLNAIHISKCYNKIIMKLIISSYTTIH